MRRWGPDFRQGRSRSCLEIVTEGRGRVPLHWRGRKLESLLRGDLSRCVTTARRAGRIRRTSLNSRSVLTTSQNLERRMLRPSPWGARSKNVVRGRGTFLTLNPLDRSSTKLVHPLLRERPPWWLIIGCAGGRGTRIVSHPLRRSRDGCPRRYIGRCCPGRKHGTRRLINGRSCVSATSRGQLFATHGGRS